MVSIIDNSEITVEHIFPQNPDPKWKLELGTDEYNFIKENYLNTISNLTLSGNNIKLGNKSFLEKKNLKDSGYNDSRLWLNQYLSGLGKWGKSEIEQRFNLILERFLEIWKYPDIEISSNEDTGEVNIFEAEDPKYKKLDYVIFLNQKIKINQVSKLYGEVFSRLFEIQPEMFFKTDLGERIGLTKNPHEKSLRQAFPINETYFVEGNIDNVGKFEKIKYALTIFGLEDELSIKYADRS
jgi:hypothetical protein